MKMKKTRMSVRQWKEWPSFSCLTVAKWKRSPTKVTCQTMLFHKMGLQQISDDIQAIQAACSSHVNGVQGLL